MAFDLHDQAAYDAQTGLFTAPSGIHKFYVGSDHLAWTP